MKRAAGGLIVGLLLAGCATAPPPQAACPVGQAQVRTAQLFLEARDPSRVNENDLRSFVDKEVTPRFPDGVTVMDGGRQWTGDANLLLRGSAKVVLIVLPHRRDYHSRMEAVRTAYRARFNQDSVIVLPPPACVAL